MKIKDKLIIINKKKITYISDTHLEFYDIDKVLEISNNIKEPIDKSDIKDNILVLAGDIGNPLHKNNHYKIFLESLSSKFDKIFIICGNHEYYGCENMKDVDDKIHSICKEISNATFLNNTFEDYLDIRWIGTTLWSEIDLINSIDSYTNDLLKIKTSKNNNLSPQEYNELHYKSIEFLDKILKNSIDKNCIIISHHLPSFSLINEKFKNDKLNQWFSGDLDDLIEEYSDRIKLWIYGHTHIPSSLILNNIKFISNPIGYPDENSEVDFHKSLIFFELNKF